MILRPVLLSALIACGSLSVGATAQTAPAPAAPATPAAPASGAMSVDTTDIGTLLDNPASKAIVDKYLPGFSSNEQVAMARSMTLRQVQTFSPDKVTDEVLTKINTDLAKLPK